MFESVDIIRNHFKKDSVVAMATYLHPLSVGLHLEDDAGVRFGQSIAVRDSFTGEPQLHFGQTGTAEQTQRVRRRLVDVTHGGGGTGSLHRKHNIHRMDQCLFNLSSSTEVTSQQPLEQDDI